MEIKEPNLEKVMKNLSDLQTEMKHPCTVDRTDNAETNNAGTDNPEQSEQKDWTPPQTECSYFLRSKKKI